MDFLKKHYEKIILGIVLVGLLGALGVLPFFISSEKEKLTALTTEVTNPRPKALTNLNVAPIEQALKRAAAPATIDFGPPNRLFNPMPWQKVSDRIIPVDKIGPMRLAVTNIVALHLKLSLDSVRESESGPKYVIGMEDEAATLPSQRTKKQVVCTLNQSSKSEPFTIVEVKGKPEDPTQLVIEMKDTRERGIIAKDQPFKRVGGYMADMYYDLEKKPFTKRRVNSQPPLSFSGEEYNIVAITQNEVVLAAKSNGKKWTIKATSNASP
jgi:hypothetical protein